LAQLEVSEAGTSSLAALCGVASIASTVFQVDKTDIFTLGFLFGHRFLTMYHTSVVSGLAAILSTTVVTFRTCRACGFLCVFALFMMGQFFGVAPASCSAFLG